MAQLYVGLMSGTSLDGVDAVLADLDHLPSVILSAAHVAFDAELRNQLAALTCSGTNEIDRAGALGNQLASIYAEATLRALRDAGKTADDVLAIGCHGQTIRHRPERGYTVQIGNAALLAELTGITVVADFRSRDIAARGQGAPLVPAFHARAFAHTDEERVILNLGGIANLTVLRRGAPPLGFDTGPGSCLMDYWVQLHLGKRYDDDGAWAAQGSVDAALLERMLDESYFRAEPPKSTGRELFNPAWLNALLRLGANPRDVQATLLELTAISVVRAIHQHAEGAGRVIACGGGAGNTTLMRSLERRLAPLTVDSSDRHGLPAQLVEATAFAWLAQQALEGHAGSLPSVTGAKGARILGAIYPGGG